jgi:hypothetical protein
VLDKRDAVLLRSGDDVWLVRDGRRSRVDPSQRPVLLALGVPGEAITTARPMSRALFDAIPVGAALTVPTIARAGEPARFADAPGPVGTVVSTPQVGGAPTYRWFCSTGCSRFRRSWPRSCRTPTDLVRRCRWWRARC